MPGSPPRKRDTERAGQRMLSSDAEMVVRLQGRCGARAAEGMPPAPALRFPLNLKQRIAILEQAIRDRPEVAANYFELADIFYWECYWIAGAIEVAEKGLALDPDRTAYRWLVIDMRSHYPLLDGIPAQYEAILKRDPNDLKALYDYSYFCREYLKDAKRAASLRARYEKIRDGD